MKLDPVSQLLGAILMILSCSYLINFLFLIYSHLYVVICWDKFWIIYYFCIIMLIIDDGRSALSSIVMDWLCK